MYRHFFCTVEKLNNKETKKTYETILWYFELIVKLGMLTVGFLEASSLTFGKPVVSIFLWPTVFGGGLVLLLRLIHWKEYWKSKNFFLLIAFCVSYLVSIVVNIRYGWYTNIRTLIWCAFLFFLVYCYKAEDSVEANQKQFKILTVYYLIANAVLSILSFAFMITGYNEIFYEEVGPIYYIGFHWGRLYGVYWDANIGAVMSCVSIILAAGYSLSNRTIAVRVLLILDAILQIFYIAFSDSRTGKLCLCVATTVYIFLVMRKKQNLQTEKQAAEESIATKNTRTVTIAILYALVGLAVAFAIPSGIKKGYNAISSVSNVKENESATEALPNGSETAQVALDGAQTDESTPYVEEQSGDATKGTEGNTEPVEQAQAEQIKEPQGLGRAEEYSDDITNRRSDIWKSALEIFKTRPIIGITHNNVLSYVEENLPDSYLINNDHMKFESMHNIFFDVLVGQGIIGLVIYLAMAVTFFIAIVKNWKSIVAARGVIGISCFVILIAMVTSSFVMTEIVYVNSPMATVFWMAMSCLMQTADQTKTVGKK